LAGSSLALLRTTRQAVLAVLILLGTQFLITHGASQYADVPWGFFMLATTVLVFLHDRASGRTRGLVALAGTAAGFAAWTKNEGLLFLASIIVARCAVLWKQRRWQGALNDLGGFALGSLPSWRFWCTSSSRSRLQTI
jgi:4-amino-4-deoxy-L-arabinose transferase-like glycosyltransferase